MLIEDYAVNNNTIKSTLVPIGSAQSQDIETDFDSSLALYGFQGSCDRVTYAVNDLPTSIYY